MAWSLLVKNGSVIDGSGAPARAADVAVEGDRIVAVGSGLSGEAARVIDAAGHAVAPGFIDMHSHSDLFYFACPSAESKVRQGVTTEVVGMCSFSQAPLQPGHEEIVRGWAGGIVGSDIFLDLRWATFAEYLDALRAIRPSVNVAHFVGHGALRIAAMASEARPADQDDAKAMAPRGGYYFSHIRGESSMLLDSINEAIRIGEEAGVGVQVSHVKASGRENWPKIDAALSLFESARARGVDVFGDVYPYNAGSTKLDNMMPAWAHAGGLSKLLERLSDRATRRRIVEECLIDGERWGTVSQGGIGFDQVFIATCRRRELEGLNLAQIARQSGMAPAETLMNLLLEEK